MNSGPIYSWRTDPCGTATFSLTNATGSAVSSVLVSANKVYKLKVALGTDAAFTSGQSFSFTAKAKKSGSPDVSITSGTVSTSTSGTQDVIFDWTVTAAQVTQLKNLASGYNLYFTAYYSSYVDKAINSIPFTAASTGVPVSSSNKILDCGGQSITSVTSGFGTGLEISGSNFVLKNCRIVGWDIALLIKNTATSIQLLYNTFSGTSFSVQNQGGTTGSSNTCTGPTQGFSC